MNGFRTRAEAFWRAAIGLGAALTLLGRAGSPPAVEDPVAAIRALYARTNDAIRAARERPGEPGGIYCTEVVVNRLSGMWRAVGNYARTTAFWYSDQPEFVAAEGRDDRAALVKAEISTTAAARTLYEEYLFAEGTLVFYYARTKDGGGAAVEDRCYFDGGRLIRRSPDPPSGDFPADPEAILRRARALQDLFVRTFE
jgi:hypothetical protein